MQIYVYPSILFLINDHWGILSSMRLAKQAMRKEAKYTYIITLLA